MLCTLGGILTDGEQRVVDHEWNPIPGLYASGNTTGRRFGSDQFTPIYGQSIGLAVTLGREADRSIVKGLEGAL
jgi:predicted oxidoreductase